ncbi:MAG TPA: hypothetical protein PKH65_10720, partial [Bacteroidia bacterium]|nr:hypothetical protein [Bacteroidia bacterium]
MLRHAIFIILFSGIITQSHAQKWLQVNALNESEQAILNELKASSKVSSIYSDSLSIAKAIQQFESELLDKAYLESSADSMHWINDTCFVFFHLGEKYNWSSLRNGNVDDYFLQQSGARIFFRDDQVYAARINRMFQRLLSAYENNGYPFAQVRLDSLRIDQQSVDGVLWADPGQLYMIDSLVIKGDAKVSQRFVEYRLGIRANDLYRENLIRQIPIRLKEIPFLQQSRDLNVRFTDKGSTVYLYLENKKASRIDGVIGFLPDANNNNKLTLSGDVKLKLQNSFGQGEL